MKAQSLRRTLWFANVFLIVALVGAGAYYVLEVRPATAAAQQKAKWSETLHAKYHKEELVLPTIYPIANQEELDAIVRRDLRNPNVGVNVGVFVGPLPPEPKEPEAVVKVEGPKDLAAIGKLLMVFDDETPTILWQFNEAKGTPKQAFRVGTFIRSHKSEPERFKLTGVAPDPESPKWKLVFDVYDDPTKDPVRKDQVASFDLGSKPTGKPSPIRPVGGPGTGPNGGGPDKTGAKPGTPSTAEGPGPVALTSSSVWIGRSGNNVRVELEQDAYERIMRGNHDELLNAVKTQVATDEKGNPKGVRVTGIEPNSLAEQFDVKPGDVLLSINGQVVHSRADAVRIVQGLPRDTTSVKIVIERNGRQIFYDIDPRDPKVRGNVNRVKYGK
jgi:hypothetical protein